MRRSLSVLLLSLAFLHLIAATAAAQDQPQPHPANLSLQVFTGLNRSSPEYVSVEAGGTRWYSHLPRNPSWREPPGTLPVKAVVLAPSKDGELAVVRVSLSRGDKFYDALELVAEYRARLDESVTVNELVKFGFEPIRFKVVRREKVALPETVGVTNLTQSIGVVRAEVTNDNAVAVRLVLRNFSPKRVSGLELHVLGEGAAGAIAWPISREGNALIEPGGEFKYALVFDGEGKEVAGGYEPALPQGVKVASVLFADGSYEGEPLSAAKNAATLAGYRTQLARVLGLIDSALAANALDMPEGVARFRTHVDGLSREPDPAAVGELVALYAGLVGKERESAEGWAAGAMHWVRQDVLDALTAFERQASAGQTGDAFRQWLVSRRTYFETWLRSLKQ